MEMKVRSIAIPSENVNDFLRLLRERTEPWKSTFWPRPGIKCEIDYPRIRLRLKKNRGQDTCLDATILETEKHAEIQWRLELPLKVKFIMVFVGIVFSVAPIMSLSELLSKNGAMNWNTLFPVIFFPSFYALWCLVGVTIYRQEQAKLGDFINSLAAEAMRGKAAIPR